MTTPLVITSQVLNNGATKRQLYVTVLAPATPAQAANTIIYDPTTTPWTTTSAYISTSIRSVRTSSSVQGTSGTGSGAYLTWDASTPTCAYSIPDNNEVSFESAPGCQIWNVLTNTGGSGVTGKIGLTTAGLVAGDTITILLDLING